MNEKRTYDLKYLNKISAGDEAFVRDMIRQFINEAPQVLLEISEYMDQKRWPEMYQTLHRFAPTLDFIGLDSIHDLVLTLEKRTFHQEKLDEAPDYLVQLTDHCLKAVEDLKEDFDL